MRWWRRVMEHCTPTALLEDPEDLRRAHLLVGLTILGLGFGSFYVAFYVAIGHLWGAAIIVLCLGAMIATCAVLRADGRVTRAATLVVIIWTVGFSAHTVIEGGMRSHSIAWLGCVIPLLAILVLKRAFAVVWCGICFVIVLTFCALDLNGIVLHVRYPDRWRPLVTMLGYVGLAVFMSLLATIFEYGRKRAFLGMQRAITARLRTQNAKEAAERASRSKDEFLAMLSHELRTPLTPVLAIASSIEMQRGLSPEWCADLETIHRNVALEAKLIDDLLDVIRIGRGKMVLDLAVVDAHSCLRSALDICRPDIEAKQLHLSVELQAVRHRVKADPVRLRQVFWNLLKNAVKFTPPKGRIFCHTSNAGDQLRIQISDTGIGIEPEVLPRLFVAFEQGEKTRTRRFGGLGLGLSIAKSMVEMQQGNLTASSGGKDKGATFTLELPTVARGLSEPPVLARPAPGKTPARPTAEPSRILLVEDDADTRSVLTRLLGSAGYRVTTADSFQKAVELTKNQEVDLLVSDLGLPDGSGLDLMRRMKARYDLPGIALSGYGTEEDLRQSRAAGFRHHLVKPVDFHDLRSAISEAMAA